MKIREIIGREVRLSRLFDGAPGWLKVGYVGKIMGIYSKTPFDPRGTSKIILELWLGKREVEEVAEVGFFYVLFEKGPTKALSLVPTPVESMKFVHCDQAGGEA
ncbi:MAG: hypothetical protein WC323_02140 [Patescibacteria group bacterium]|jgi:hypothetical protein